jgi:hypothetical protein
MAILKINGRDKFFNCDTIELTPTGNGRWSVTYNRKLNDDGEVIDQGRTFDILGGTQSGGAADEWACRHPVFYGDRWLDCRSMVAAIELGVTY